MKKLFYLGFAGLALFEIARVWFIMPLPGSQRIESLDVAYFLHAARWWFRVAFSVMIAAGLRAAFRNRKWLPAFAALAALAVVWLFNFQMTAEKIFAEPRSLVFSPRETNKVDEEAVVIGVEHGGEAKAYPVRFLVYHHQVRDTVGGKAVIVTYCSVCRTGRVFEPVVEGRRETFRLVGMDHFNAMFEDSATGSWWRQATGEAVAGPLKGRALPEVDCAQVSAAKWFELHPRGVVMQPDAASAGGYDTEGKFERGETKGKLTRTDAAAWQEKSWVVGVRLGGASKAYDWNRLKTQRVINDTLGGKPLVLALATDGRSFVAFERPAGAGDFTIHDDVLSGGGKSYDFAGRAISGPVERLRAVPAHQEFWHSWRMFRGAAKDETK